MCFLVFPWIVITAFDIWLFWILPTFDNRLFHWSFSFGFPPTIVITPFCVCFASYTGCSRLSSLIQYYLPRWAQSVSCLTPPTTSIHILPLVTNMDSEEDSDHYEEHYTDTSSASNEEMEDHLELDTDNGPTSLSPQLSPAVVKRYLIMDTMLTWGQTCPVWDVTCSW